MGELVTKEFCEERHNNTRKDVAGINLAMQELASKKDLATHMQQIGSLVAGTMQELNGTLKMVADTQSRVVKFLWYDNGVDSVQSQLRLVVQAQDRDRKFKWLVIGSCVSALIGMAIRANW